MRAPALAALAVAALLAGCAAPAQPVAPTPGGGPASMAAGSAEALALPGAPFALYLTPDLGLVPEPGAAGTVTLTTPVNGPMTPGYPAWAGPLPAAANVTSAGVAVTLFVQSNSASVRANQVPAFAGLPAMFLHLALGNLSLDAEADGPPVLHAGHVYQVNATLAGDTGAVEAGAAATLSMEVIYSHVAGGAEFQFVMGPDQPARLDFA